MEEDPSPPPTPPPESALVEELEEEVLLRFPPSDPSRLVRAALVCRRWRALVTGAGFRRRFRELHAARAPAPMLGLLCNAGPGTRFLPFSAFRPRGGPGLLLLRGWRALDARHGRVLLRWHADDASSSSAPALVVWDPVTDRRTDLPALRWAPYPYSWNAAVLCAATSAGGAACDHLDCCSGGGHFLVVLVGTNSKEMFACVYSSEAGVWGDPTTARHPGDNVDFAPTALVGDAALYFAFQRGTSVLEYNLGTKEMEVVRLPPASFDWQRIVLADRSDGCLGFVTADRSAIYLWARKAPPQGDVYWALTRVVELDKLHPVGALAAFADVVGFVDSVGVVFVRTGDGLFTIDIKSSGVTKVSDDIGFSGIFPYMSFHTPALRVPSAGEGPSVGE